MALQNRQFAPKLAYYRETFNAVMEEFDISAARICRRSEILNNYDENFLICTPPQLSKWLNGSVSMHSQTLYVLEHCLAFPPTPEAHERFHTLLLSQNAPKICRQALKKWELDGHHRINY